MNSLHRILFVALPLLFLGGCNTVGTADVDGFDQKIAEIEDQLERVTLERDALRAGRGALDGRLQSLTNDLTRTRSKNTELQSSLDVTRQEFERAHNNWQRQLDEFQQQSIALKIHNDDVEATTTDDGNIRLTVPSEVLFQPGSEVIGSRGSNALEEVRRILNTEFPGNHIAICGHTDSDPIRRTKKRFDSNMDLSLARAHAVYSFLWKQGLENPRRVRAVGYGEFQPKVDNSSKANKSLNRRVEVIVFAN